MASCVRTVHEQRRAHTLLRALCCSERASTVSVGRPVERRDGATLSADELLYFLLLQCKKHSTARKDERGLHRKRTGMCRVLATAAPALAALRLAHEHTRAEHARHARTTRARLTSHAHALTRQHALTSKAWLLPCSSHWPLADRRPARRWHIWLTHALQTRSPSPLRAIPMHRRHAVHAIHLHRCTLPPYGRET